MCLSRLFGSIAAALALMFALGAQAADPNARQLESCLKKMGAVSSEAATPEATSTEKEASQAPLTSQGAIKIAVTPIATLQQMLANLCYIGDQAAIEELASVSLAIPRTKLPKIETGGAKFLGNVPEPGLLGLDGAREVLTDLLVAEAMGLWVVGKTFGSQLPAPAEDQIQAYVDANLDLAEKDTDGALALRIRTWERVKGVVLGREAPSVAEKRLIAALEKYIQNQYVRMAYEAQRKYKEYQEEMSKPSTQTAGMASLLHTGHPPYDPQEELRSSLVVLSANALGLYIATGSLNEINSRKMGSILDRFEVKVDDDDDIAEEAVERLAKDEVKPKAKPKGPKVTQGGRTGKGASASVKKAITRVAKLPVKAARKVGHEMVKASAKVFGMLGSKALLAVPILGAIADVAITSVEMITKITKTTKIEKELAAAVETAKNTDWDLKKMLNTRDGAELAQFFFIKATSAASPSEFRQEPPACRACFFTEASYQGEYFCTAGRESDLRGVAGDGGEPRKFNNRVRSVQILGDRTCQSPSVTLYNRVRHAGEKTVLRESEPDLAALARGKNKTWDKAAGSVEYKQKGAPRCEACLYRGQDFGGTKICTDAPIANLHDLGFGDKVSSVRLHTKGCPKAKLWLYAKKDFERRKDGSGIANFTRDARAMPRGMNNTVSSVYFSSSGSSPKETRAHGGCRVCLYANTGYRGNYVCFSPGDSVKDLDEVKSGDEIVKFRNQASSAEFLDKDCKAGEKLEMAIYTRQNFRGTREILTKSTSDLDKMDNKVSSAVLAARSEESIEDKCRVCLFTKENFKGDRKCFDGDYSNLGKVKFANKAESVKFELNKCEKGGAATFYSKKGQNGDTLYAYKDIPDLKDIKRGKRGHWKDAISSLKFGDDKRAAIEAAYKRLGRSVPWAHK